MDAPFCKPILHYDLNEAFDFTLMDILKNNWNSPLDYVVSLFNIYCNTNITQKIKFSFNMYN